MLAAGGLLSLSSVGASRMFDLNGRSVTSVTWAAREETRRIAAYLISLGDKLPTFSGLSTATPAHAVVATNPTDAETRTGRVTSSSTGAATVSVPGRGAVGPMKRNDAPPWPEIGGRSLRLQLSSSQDELPARRTIASISKLFGVVCNQAGWTSKRWIARSTESKEPFFSLVLPVPT